MPDTIKVASRVHTDVVIHEPLPDEFRDKPGEAPELRSVVLNGAGHPSAVGDVGITEGVPADLFTKWMEANKSSPIVANGLLYKLDGDPEDVEYGFQPALDRAPSEPTSEPQPGPDAAPGKPVPAKRMAATSAGVPDDSARSQTRAP